MDLLSFSYTIGVKRRFFPIFYKKYKVLKHATEPQGDTIRLVLTAVDGSVIVIPEITKRQWIVYPDFIVATKNYEAFKQGKTSPSVITREESTDGLRV